MKRNNMQENFVIKVYWIWHDFEVEATRYKQKTEIFLVTRPTNSWKSGSCFWFVRKGKERIKANLYLNLMEILFELLSYKNISQIASKTFATQHLLKQAFAKQHAERPQQILAKYGHIS